VTSQTARTIGSLTGLAVAIGLMVLLQLSGVLWGAIFGASGAVLGSIVAERLVPKG